MDSMERRYKPWLPGRWASTLPASYFSEMARAMEGVFHFGEEDHASGYVDYVMARNIFGRMELAQLNVMPRLVEAIHGLTQKSVLEIGCGTGSATVPLAMASCHVYAFDIAPATVEVARRRCELLDITNVTLVAETTTWPARFAEEPISPPVEVVVCYALLEHLLPLERIDVLVGAWKHLPMGGHLVVIETPNRLYPFDWHSSQLPFMDQIPEEIAYLWNAFSPRVSIPSNICATSRADVAKSNRDRLYRFGRGASFHEFHTALGADAYKVVASLDRMEMMGTKADYIDMLKRQLAEVTPAVHPGFAYPSLDLVIEKTGPARLS